MATRQMAAFMEKNQTAKIVFGERRTPDNRPVRTKADLDCSDRVLYRFDDGEEVVLLGVDARSQPEYSPKWAI